MAQIKCGNCHEYHDTAAAVLDCYRVNKFGQAPLADDRSDYMNGPSIERVRPVAAKSAPNDEDAAAAAALDSMAGLADKSDGPLWPASDAQIKYVLGLQDERRLPDDWTIRDEATLKGMERDEVSSLITMLKAFPRGDAKQHQWSMPPGRYAIKYNDEWWFFQIDKPTFGRWAGYTFIKRLIGAPGDYQKVDMSVNDRNRVLADIERDARTASVNFGLQSGTCGICSSPLTNAESLALGIGPKCRAKVGW